MVFCKKIKLFVQKLPPLSRESPRPVLADGQIQQQGGHPVGRGGLFVDDHQVLSPEVTQQTGGRIDCQAGTAHDQRDRLRRWRAWRFSIVSSSSPSSYRTTSGFDDAAALGAAGHPVALAGSLLDEFHRVEFAAPGAVIAQSGAVQFVDHPAGRAAWCSPVDCSGSPPPCRYPAAPVWPDRRWAALGWAPWTMSLSR